MISVKERKFVPNRTKFNVGQHIQIKYKQSDCIYKVIEVGNNIYRLQRTIVFEGTARYYAIKTYAVSYVDKYGINYNLETMKLLYA